jgi:hypothetical protein
MRLAATAALIAALLLPNAVRADDLDTVFPGEELICYARIYTGGHLAAHPQQTVTSIRLFRDEAPVPSSGQAPSRGRPALPLRQARGDVSRQRQQALGDRRELPPGR